MRALAALALVAAAAFVGGCGGGDDPQPETLVDPEAVRSCLIAAEVIWAELPLSDFGIAFAVEFDKNSVNIYVEPSVGDVEKERESIRAAEDEVGNTAPEQRVIISERGNVLLSWANEPTDDEKDLTRECVGFA